MLPRSPALLAATVLVTLSCALPEAQAGKKRAKPAASSPTIEPVAEGEMEVRGDLGSLDLAAVEAVMVREQASIEQCYRKELAQFHYLGGKLEVRVRVGGNGAARRTLVTAPLGSIAVERCVVGIVRTLRFPAPEGAKEAEFAYAWEFRPAVALREWREEDVRDVFRRHLADLRSCERRGNVPPKLRITVFVAAGGRVGSVGVGGDGALTDEYVRCVAAKVGAWRFPDPLGQVARATYRFH